MKAGKSLLADIIRTHEDEILGEWIGEQKKASTRSGEKISEADLKRESAAFLRGLVDSLQAGDANTTGAHWKPTRDALGELSASRARKGFTPTETAMFVFSLKQPVFNLLRKELQSKPADLAEETWEASVLLDQLGLVTTDQHQRTREDVIMRQQRELMELSTPVVELWDNILALPLIGTLDSNRTQVVMESLLQKIVESGAAIAIIDITGVPTVDTLVAQHLMKTVAAARLMGADCIISGIRPQIAQTIVHLGVDLTAVTTKASLADAFRLALARTGASITSGAKVAKAPKQEGMAPAAG
jgi:rsbT co-antagonist protein RsbR